MLRCPLQVYRGALIRLQAFFRKLLAQRKRSRRVLAVRKLLQWWKKLYVRKAERVKRRALYQDRLQEARVTQMADALLEDDEDVAPLPQVVAQDEEAQNFLAVQRLRRRDLARHTLMAEARHGAKVLGVVG